MHWIGRLAYPLFAFLCVQACEHTHNMRRYVIRLYIASVGMSVVELMLNRTGNAFTALFHLALIIGILSLRKPSQKVAGIIGYLAWQVVANLMLLMMWPVVADWGTLPAVIFENVLGTAFGLAGTIDGGYIYVLLGLLIWACHKSRIRLTVAFSIFCVILFMLFNIPRQPEDTWNGIVGMFLYYLGLPSDTSWMPFTYNYQWMMIGALPFMLLYNGQRGRPVKWLFYWFYPMHLIVITILMHLLGVQSYGV